MNRTIRLGCMYCDRGDFDGVDKFPKDWEDIHEVQSLAEAKRAIWIGWVREASQRTRSASEPGAIVPFFGQSPSIRAA